MAEVPKIVRERLSRPSAVGEHPDANLISAFAERALTEPERTQVLDHLSRCAECRQIVALTAAEAAEERLAAAVAADRAPSGVSRSWWRSPILHWGAFTAAALVVMIAVGARLRLREGRSASAPAIATVSSNEVAQKSTIPVLEVARPPAEPKQSSKKPAEPSGPTRQAPAVNAGKPGGVAGGIIGGSLDKGGAGFGTGSGGGIGSGRGAQSAPATAPTPVAPQMKMQAKAADVGGFPSDTGVEKSSQKVTPAPPAASETVIVTNTAPALKSEGAVGSKSRSAGMSAKRASLTARWSISDSGALQRSFDGGRSWNQIAVADGVTFRAVAAVGNDVWAGGSSGALFHSADGGERWSRVPVQAKDRAPSGDIVRVEFADAQDGVITTSTGETWTTFDAGATWQPQ